MKYELWQIDSEELIGKIDIPNTFDHTNGALVTVKFKECVEYGGEKYTATQVRVCIMRDRSDPNADPEEKKYYYALETHYPFSLVAKLEGFEPRILLAGPSDARYLQ